VRGRGTTRSRAQRDEGGGGGAGDADTLSSIYARSLSRPKFLQRQRNSVSGAPCTARLSLRELTGGPPPPLPRGADSDRVTKDLSVADGNCRLFRQPNQRLAVRLCPSSHARTKSTSRPRVIAPRRGRSAKLGVITRIISHGERASGNSGGDHEAKSLCGALHRRCAFSTMA
jgi:hypothetical protein